MNAAVNRNPGVVVIEIQPASLKIARGSSYAEMELQRTPAGLLTPECRLKVKSGVEAFLNRKPWRPAQRAICAIAAGGVSLRRMLLPITPASQLQAVLLLQLETDFPLPPAEMAWGYRKVSERTEPGGTPQQEILLAATRKETIAEYASLLGECGLNPEFTLSTLARAMFCPPGMYDGAVLEIGTHSSELLIFEKDTPASSRSIPWGSSLWTQGEAADAALASFAGFISSIWKGSRLFVISPSVANAITMVAKLAVHLPPSIHCEVLSAGSAEVRSTALAGLKKALETDGGKTLLFLRTELPKATGIFAVFPAGQLQPMLKTAAVLCAVLVLLPYAEAILFKPHLAKTIARIEADESRRTMIDRELAFLQSLKQTQPPYLDALYLFSKSAPMGTHIESLSMNRNGEVSLRGMMNTGDQVTDFRKKLIDSGFFSSVVVEEQSPGPNNQRVNIRLILIWKPASVRAAMNFGPTDAEIQKPSTGKDKPGKPPATPATPPGKPL